MGLFDLFRKKDASSSQDRELSRLQKMIANKLSQNFDRQEALERLSQMGTSEAVRILLQRFTWNLDPSITDQEEKELVVEGIARAGEAALEPIRSFARKAESLSWPLKGLRRVVQGERFEAEVLGWLELFDTEYQRNPEPKIQLLQALEEFPTEATRRAVEPFLNDSNEAVRFAAVTTLFRIGLVESTDSLVVALADDESLRIKNRIAQGLAEKGWALEGGLLDRVSSVLPVGFSVQSSRVVGSIRG